jgi:hypothetical protein
MPRRRCFTIYRRKIFTQITCSFNQAPIKAELRPLFLKLSGIQF